MATERFSHGRKALRWLPILLAISILVFWLRSYLEWGSLPARGDPTLPFQGSDLTPVFSVWARMAIHAMKDQGVLPFWNPFTHAGAPLFEIPQAASISLSSLLGFFLPAEIAIKGAMVVHALLGLVGTYVMGAVILNLAPSFAAIGGLAFGLGTYFLDHFKTGHLNQANAMAWVPWSLFAFWKAIESKRHSFWWAILSGITVGFQVLEGGDSVLLYEAIAFFFIPLSILLFSPKGQWERLIKGVSLGVVAALTAFAVCAFQLLPMMAYLPSTGRTACLPLEFAREPISEVRHPAPGFISLALIFFGIYSFWKTNREVMFWLVATLATVAVIASFSPAFEFLWRFMPGFCFQRIPERALALMGVVAPLLVAVGVSEIWKRLKNRYPQRVYINSVLILGVIFSLVFELWWIAPRMPVMASVQTELKSNSAMQWLSQKGIKDRIHIWESADRHWGTEHVTVPLGLEVIAGYTSSEHQDYFPFDFLPSDHRNFFKEAYQSPAKLWGMLNVRYVLSTESRNKQDFVLAEKVPSCPLAICQPSKSSGPWIYENKKALPRAYQVRHALAVVGESRASFETILDIFQQPLFDPAKLVLIQTLPGEPLPEVDLAITSRGTSISGVNSWDSKEGKASVTDLLQRVQRDSTSFVESQFTRPNMNQIQVYASGSGWLVVSERVGLFPGWSALFQNSTQNSTKTKIYRANGILGALKLSSQGQVLLQYEPPRFKVGLWILFAGSILMLGVGGILRLRDFRESKKTIS